MVHARCLAEVKLSQMNDLDAHILKHSREARIGETLRDAVFAAGRKPTACRLFLSRLVLGITQLARMLDMGMAAEVRRAACGRPDRCRRV